MAADGKLVYLLVEDAGKDDLYEVDASGGKPVPVVEPPSGGYTASTFRRRARSRCSSPPMAARYPRRRSCAST